jgi:NAD(P)-dependent dehydrogenase (short-subunit alcohol dehydrogenase family)
VVLVTGASSGVGLALAQVLSGSGQYKVYATARQPNKVEQLQQLVKERSDTLEVLTLDVTKESTIQESIDYILKKDGKIDVLVNNAGFSFAKPTELTSMDEFREIFDTNFFGVVATSKAVIPHMRAAKSGHIINISSVGGLLGQPFNDAYCAAKFAVCGLTESMYQTLIPFGIKVTLVCPGAITTPFLAKAASSVVPSGENNPYTELQNMYVENVTKIFAGNAASGIKSSQTAEEIAEIIKKIAELEKPDFCYTTSEYVTNFAATKLVDVTGNSSAEFTSKRCFGGTNLNKK